VYGVRPVACRIHNSVTPSERCMDATSQRIEVEGLLEEHAQFCRDAAAKTDGLTALGPLPAMVLASLLASDAES